MRGAAASGRQGDGPLPGGAGEEVRAAPARRCAYAVLRRVFEHGAYADRAFHAQAHGLAARDRALAMRLAYGAVQRRGTCDALIEHLAARRVRRLDAAVAAALRLGLYELLYLEGAPARAIVDDAVELAKAAGSHGHGLVNAVLRRAAREGPEWLGALGEETPERAAILHSHPEWLAQMWWEELGAEQARALMARDNEPGEVAVRVNTLRADAGQVRGALPVAAHGDPALPEALVLEGPLDLQGSELWAAGAVTAQSRAAMMVGRALAPVAGERVLDLCAAPGGKTTHLAALMGDEGEIVAVERNPARARALERTAERMGASCVRVEVGDAAARREDGAFDRVLVDPPCSGLGVLQARADLRWRVSPEAVSELGAAQARILAAGADALRPGGVLVYSTCTISSSENERQIEALLDSREDLTIDDLGALLPSLRMGRFLLTLPHRDHTAGFFIARLRRG